MKDFFEYLEIKFNKTEMNNRVSYSFKVPPDTLIAYHEDILKRKKVFWTPNNLGMVEYTKSANKNEANDIKKEIKEYRKENQTSIFRVEEAPKWYLKFISKYRGLSIFRGSIHFSTAVAMNSMCKKPRVLNGKFLIGEYADITPKSCPIFTDDSGAIYVYDAKQFRNYPESDKKEDWEAYLNQKVELIAQWNDIDSFLIEETDRLESLYVQNPSLYAIDNCNPKK